MLVLMHVIASIYNIIIMITIIILVALHNNYGSPYGSSPMLPLIVVDCGFGHISYNPVLDDIGAECRIVNQSTSCSLERSIIGISCGGKQCMQNYLH